jgi:hypothetical protein
MTYNDDEVVDFIVDDEYFGPNIGNVGIIQRSRLCHHNDCLAQNSQSDDSTGLRVYSASHILLRFLCSNECDPLVRLKSVVELGCGTGAVGLLSHRHLQYENLLQTDGNDIAIQLCQKNHEKLLVQYDSRVSCQRLLWGAMTDIQNILNKYNHSKPFDVIIGSDLMYYNVSVEDLLSTVLKLCDCNGLFIHAHLFRVNGYDQFMRNILSIHNWKSLCVPLETFMNSNELEIHPHWYCIYCLISGPHTIIDQLLFHHPQWKYFETCELYETFDSEL